MSACLLALDTATDQLALGLATPGGRWLHDGPGGAQSSAQVLPELVRLMAQAGLGWAALDGVAFGAGPGAFTGLRTACAVAQGLAFGAGKPVLSIDSLLVLAEDARVHAGQGDGPWWVAVDARMDEVYAAEYLWHQGTPVPTGPAPAGLDALAAAAEAASASPSDSPVPGQTTAPTVASGWQVLQPPRLYTWPALAQRWRAQPPARLAGNASLVFADRLPLAGVACWPQPQARAAALLRLAEQAWAQGLAGDPADALPLYVRDKVALTTAERAAAAAAVA